MQACRSIISGVKFIVVLLLLAPQVDASERAAQKAFDRVRHDPVELRGFLLHFPKGGDLHNHIDGAIYAENLIDWAAQDGKCIDLDSYRILPAPCDTEKGLTSVAEIALNRDVVNKIVDAFSIRSYQLREKSGFVQFFSTFFNFDYATHGREGDMISEASQRAANQNTYYLELMQSWGMADARASAALTAVEQEQRLDQIALQSMALLDRAEQRRRDLQNCDHPSPSNACAVEVAYIAQVIRVFPRDQVRAQVKLAVRLMERDPRIVGITFVAAEDDPVSLRDYAWQMEMLAQEIQHLPEIVRNINLHAGELTLGLVPPEQLGWHIRAAIEVAGANRIGHGIDIIYDPDREQLLNHMATNRIAVEINLTSNDVILDVAEDEHPFNLYRQHGVPICLSTDDEGVLRTDLTHQYQRAVLSYELSYKDIKQFARNALTYSFQQGVSLFDDNDYKNLVQVCRQLRPGKTPSPDCAEFIKDSNKASLQWALEKRFHRFESNYD